MTEVRDLLPLYALGILTGVERALVDRAVAADPVLAAELAAFHASTTALVTPVLPSPEVHARLLASIGGGRFEPFAARTAAMFDVTVEWARELLGLVERRASWEPQVVPGIHLVHFVGGPRYADADCGFIRLAPGSTFPPHTHMGEEVSLVISGRMRDVVTGLVLVPGDELLQAETSGHSLTCEGDEACIYVARAMHGIEVMGTLVRPHRP